MFQRNKYLNELISLQNNHLIKVITGVRRSGKSFLLNEIFYTYLYKEKGIDKSHIIKFALDNSEDIEMLEKYLPEEPTTKTINGQKIINNRKFLYYIRDLIHDDNIHYILLDEIQNLDDFVRILNGFLKHDNYDVYVTGGNSNMLSSNIDTEFGGRSSRIHLLPLTFSEFLSGTNINEMVGLQVYERYGGIPIVQLQRSDEQKVSQAISIYKDTYLTDVLKRHPKVDKNNVEETLKVISSMISTPINPTKIENTFKSQYKISLSNNIISNYIDWFEETFLLNKTMRYDIKGRHYIGSPYKIYFEDIGIRNAILNFRDIDETDLIENIVYNELRYRGFNLDVGIVNIKAKTDRKDKNNKWIYTDKETECDFVANKSNKTYYIQVALTIDTKEKKNQEYESIRNIPNSFKKVIIVKNEGLHYYTEDGFLRISLLDFLLNIDSLDW